MYDDLLILFAMIALLRWLRQNAPAGNLAAPAGCLVGAAWLGMMMPASAGAHPFPWNLSYEIGLLFLWCAMLFFIGYIVRRTKVQSSVAGSAPTPYP